MNADAQALLAVRTEQGTLEAARWLYETQGPRLWRAVRLHLADTAAAEDLFQEVFVAALEQLPGYAGQSTPYTWLFGIFLNKARSSFARYRTEQKGCQRLTGTLSSEELLRADPAALAAQAEARALLAVPEPERTAEEQAALSAHLKACASCQHEGQILDHVERWVTASLRVDCRESPPALALKRRRPAATARLWPYGVGAAAALLLAGVGALGYLLGQTSPLSPVPCGAQSGGRAAAGLRALAATLERSRRWRLLNCGAV